MAAIGGSVEDVSIKGRLFAVAADADGNRKLGGFENEIQMNGNGTYRLVKTRVPWLLDGLTLVVDDDRDDQKFLQDIADSEEEVEVTATFANGNTFQANGTIVGELGYSSQSATCSVTLSGGGKMTQQ